MKCKHGYDEEYQPSVTPLEGPPEPCPYCEIDRLREELEQVRKELKVYAAYAGSQMVMSDFRTADDMRAELEQVRIELEKRAITIDVANDAIATECTRAEKYLQLSSTHYNWYVEQQKRADRAEKALKWAADHLVWEDAEFMIMTVEEILEKVSENEK